MGRMKELYNLQQEELWEEYEEHRRNELRSEGAIETCKMIRYELLQRYEASLRLGKPSDDRPTALREALQIVESYL